MNKLNIRKSILNNGKNVHYCTFVEPSVATMPLYLVAAGNQKIPGSPKALIGKVFLILCTVIHLNMKKPVQLLLFLILLISTKICYTQGSYKTESAGPEYKTSSFHQWLWGRNYRKEWSTPVRLPVVMLDTLKGGLTPAKAGGGNQTQSLHLKTKAEKEYTMRSVNKSLGKVLPKDFLGTFIEDIVDDKVSMSHPYAAAAVPVLANAAGIYHTYPRYVYLPEQPALDSFNKKFGNDVYLFEQKVEGNWKEAANLGNFEDFMSTDKLLEKMYEDNDNQVDQRLYVRSRLFDMFINDWDRHEDQWEWGKVESNGLNVYKPVPQDRDQAFFNYNGVLLKFAMGASGMKYFQQFKNTIPDVTTFNYEQRNLDRFFANQMTLSDWQTIAKELQQALTDNVIETSLKQMPAEIYPIRSKEIAATLKARRDHLEELATTYYKFIAKEVDVIGSRKREHFEVIRKEGNETMVNIYKINEQGKKTIKPFYMRTFNAGETGEIRLYGLSGNDTYSVEGSEDNKTTVRLIGGVEKDSIAIAGKGKVHVYDNKDNYFPDRSSATYHLSNDTSINTFDYSSFKYSKKGISPVISYNNEDRLFVGLGYGILTHKWRKEPFASKQSITGIYSISQRAPRVLYNGFFPGLFGKTDFALTGEWDGVRWTNFFGLGNETRFVGGEIDFYRTRTEEWLARASLIRKLGHNTLRLNGFYRSVRVINDEQRFVAKNLNQFAGDVFNKKHFGGAELQYTFVQVNDSLVPTRGFAFWANGSYTQNLRETSRSVQNYSSHLHLYVPLIPKVSLALRAGGATVAGEPEFYQYSSIGGSQTVRAFRRDRFWGKHAFYNSNELRFINKVKTHLFNGSFGLVAFYDNGRVWLPGENSDVWHTGYGGGILLAPFNKVLADITYGVSKDENLIQLRLSRSF